MKLGGYMHMVYLFINAFGYQAKSDRAMNTAKYTAQVQMFVLLVKGTHLDMFSSTGVLCECSVCIQ